MVQFGTVLMKFRVTHHPAASRQPHKTALNTTCCRTEQVYWNGTFCFLLRWGSSCSLGLLCPLNSSIFVYHTLAYLHVDSSRVLPVYSNWHRRLTDTRPSSPSFLWTVFLKLCFFFVFALLFKCSFNCKAERVEAAADWIAYPETWQVAALCCETWKTGTRGLVRFNDKWEVGVCG